MGRFKSLDRMDMLGPVREEAEYEAKLKKAQKRLLQIQQWIARSGKRAVIAIEGWDAAGKGGLIQRMSAELDPRPLHVWRIAAPTPDEQGRHYLWRFWQRLPPPGEIAIYDRTWYGRVLVERIEGYCDAPAWKRAYDEIVDFEKLLTDDGVLLVKLLLHVSADEQKRRIVERLESKTKRYKVSVDDFRNMGRRKEYLQAFDDMLEKTDRKNAPWTVVATDHKWRARLQAMGAVCEQLGGEADLEPPPLDPKVAEAAKRGIGWTPTEKAK